MTVPLTAARAQKRILEVVTLMNNGVHDVPAPEDKAVQDFYQKNSKIFVAPEYRGLTIARLSTDDIAKDTAMTDEQMQKEYAAHSQQYEHAERRDVLQVVITNEAKARQLTAAARTSGNLPNAAGVMGYKTVPLNDTEEKTLLPELAAPVFALKPGEISDPIKSPLGWHVVQLKKITPAGIPNFADIKDQLRETMQRDQAVDTATRTVNQLDDELAAGHALEDIADSLKLRLIKVAAVDAKGKTPEGKEPSEFPNKEDVLKAGFEQGSGESSPVIDDKKGNYIVVRTDEIVASAVRPFEQVKDKVLAAWKAQAQAKLAASQAETIAKGLREGKGPATFAALEGIDVRVSRPLSMLDDTDPTLPPAVIAQIFNMKKGDVITSSQPDRQLILRLAEIVNPDNTPGNANQARVGGEARRQLPIDLSLELVNYLRQVYPVWVDQEALDTLRQQGG
jgi:peptidyl-prolyl cis-trans isomerase D